MPVTLLLVEGELDAQLLHALLAGRPVVEAAKSSKYALAPRARTEREKGNAGAHYLRDRDFDFLPPSDCSAPVPDRQHNGSTLGWRWCRHEIESYMLEPAIVAACAGIDRSSYGQSLLTAARSIRYYQAARWTIGQARVELPPRYEPDTRPVEAANNEFYLPSCVGQEEMRGWAREHIDAFRTRLSPSLDDASITRSYDESVERFGDSFFLSPANPLVWFSGKDLMAAVAPLWGDANCAAPGDFRTLLRDWMKANIEASVEILHEWEALKRIVQGNGD